MLGSLVVQLTLVSCQIGSINDGLFDRHVEQNCARAQRENLQQETATRNSSRSFVEQAELIALLDAADFDAVIGTAESGEIDFKRSPYRTGTDAEAFELAKDVTALANVPTGGLLVIGFQTVQREESGLDTVESVHVFPRDLFNREQWLAKIDQLAYPTVVGLDAIFKPSSDDDERGVAIIVVPPQSDDARYFLVAKEFTSEDGAPGWAVGLSVRSADRNRPLSIGEIHSLLSRSLHLGTDLSEVKALVRDMHANVNRPAEQPVPADLVVDRLRQALDAWRQ
jgi:hypothetical protein